MPTLWSQTLIPTLREVPAEAEVPSHQLMLRAGLISRLGAGVYSYLPLGLRSLQKVMAIIREEMAAAGAVEVFLPTLIPIELFKQTGRDEAYGENLFRLTDRHQREQALGPTHEEVITTLVGSYISSYKDLPKTLYQIQTKFRDEFRPRFGVLRSREFQMKDAYSFHLNVDGPGGLNEVYQAQYDAYCRIFDRCGLPYEIVEAESGPIGGSASHEFMVPSPTGEDTILKSDSGKYAANVEKCEIGERAFNLDGAPTGEFEKVHTPNCATIEDVCRFMKVKPKHMLKTLVCRAGEEFVLAVVRGDHDLNIGKLRAASKLPTLDLADESEARAKGFVVGFVGPHAGLTSSIYIDEDAAQDQFWVTGANQVDHHVKHFNWRRDVQGPVELKVADIRNAVDGDPAPAEKGGGTLRTTKGIEIGHVFKLGDKYSRALDVTVLDEKNERKHLIMGCYGIGCNRILAAAIERQQPRKGYDEAGIIWPSSIAPYQVLITPIKYDGKAKEVALQIASELERVKSPTQPLAFFHPDVLIDDRDERPGVKFKDADLIGFPVRITIGDKGLADPSGPKVEIKARDGSNGPKGELVPVEHAAARVLELLKSL